MIEANNLVFPRPKEYDPTSIKNHIIYIPKSPNYHHLPEKLQDTDDITSQAPTARSINLKPKKESAKTKLNLNNQSSHCHSGYIPCIYLKGTDVSNKIVVYFHSNAEDLSGSFDLAFMISVHLGRSVLVVEYPGYSAYSLEMGEKNFLSNNKKKFGNKSAEQKLKSDKELEPTSEQIEEDSKHVIYYINQTMNYNLTDITIMGRSIGSGPAVYLASLYKIESLILISPFLSIKDAVKDLYGEVCSKLIKQRFNNLERAKSVTSPVLLIHGLEDKIIPCHHSVTLAGEFVGYSVIKIVEKMKHNSFNFYADFLCHVQNFMRKIEK